MSAALVLAQQARFCGCEMVPPPSETMRGFCDFMDSPTTRSKLLVLDAPEFRLAHAAKISGMERPVASVMRLSRSMCGQPSWRATQPGRGGLAAAHESRKADEPARTIFADHSFDSAMRSAITGAKRLPANDHRAINCASGC